jgi:hypothetical protein
MGACTEPMIKKSISECIVEEMFRDLGFYVIRIGKEHTISPLVQLQSFVKNCGGEFKLEKETKEFLSPIGFVNKLPDFLIVHKNGDVDFLEVKYSRDGYLWRDKFDVFEHYPNAFILAVNSTVSDLMNMSGDKVVLEDLKKTRFHVWMRGENWDKEKNPVDIKVKPLKELVAEKCENSAEIINKYEHLVSKWLSVQ